MNESSNQGYAVEVLQARAAALPLKQASDLEPLLECIDKRVRVVGIGDASHGTREFYKWRNRITQLLIKHGFNAIAIEADQEDAKVIDRCIRHPDSVSIDPGAVLAKQRHWPSWLWANAETVEFCRWLQGYNRNAPIERQVRWQGLDTYPLWGATRGILEYVHEYLPGQVNKALDAPLRDQPMVPENHIEAVVRHLVVTTNTDPSATNREEYYRALIHGGAKGVNARATHWLDAVEQLLSPRGAEARVVLWAHNTHVGDARGTDTGMLSIGQLARERYGPDEVVLIGFAGGEGTVIAAHERGGNMDTFNVPKPRPGSLEALLDEATGGKEALFPFPKHQKADWLTTERGHRAIGAVYPPQEIYIPTQLSQRYDVLCWHPRVTAVQALHFKEARLGELETLRVLDQGD